MPTTRHSPLATLTSGWAVRLLQMIRAGISARAAAVIPASHPRQKR